MNIHVCPLYSSTYIGLLALCLNRNSETYSRHQGIQAPRRQAREGCPTKVLKFTYNILGIPFLCLQEYRISSQFCEVKSEISDVTYCVIIVTSSRPRPRPPHLSFIHHKDTTMDPLTPYCRELASPGIFQAVLSMYVSPK